MSNFKKRKIMKNYILIPLLSTILLASCTDFGDLNTNPNVTTKVTSSMLATNMILDMMKTDNSDVLGKGYLYDDFLAKYLVLTELIDDRSYNRLSRVGFGSLTILNNASRMIEAAPEGNARNSYKALSHFIRVKKFFDLTMRVGDIPYSEALQGDNELFYPKYDTQKDVFLGLLNELDEADRLFGQGAKFDGDFIYNGDPLQWQKAANVLQLKLLINLYRKTGEADLKVKERFQTVLNRPIFTSNADNFQIVYSEKAGQKYPYYKEGNNYMMFIHCSSILIDSLKQYVDRRLFYYTQPTPAALSADLPVDEWDSYNGVDPTLKFVDLLGIVNTKNVSKLNDRYSELPAGEPIALLSYSEMNMIIAEAIARGILAGDAKAYYEEGIKAAMKFTADNTPDNPLFHHNMKITDEYINEYLQGSNIRFASSTERQIQQIIMQKYIAAFLQLPYTAFFEYRRTGIPYFPINPESNLNTDPTKMPLRWMYPQAEFDYNGENANEALHRQYQSDDFNEAMWILK
jgi:hypothetical protein